LVAPLFSRYKELGGRLEQVGKELVCKELVVEVQGGKEQGLERMQEQVGM
jgi:hypothetical protein